MKSKSSTPRSTKPRASEQQAKLNERRAEALTQIIDEIDAKERGVWIRGFADTVSAAVQSGTYPAGLERLQAMFERLNKADDKELAAYREIPAHDGRIRRQPSRGQLRRVRENPNRLGGEPRKIRHRFPKSPDTADAMLQLGLSRELAGPGQADKAKEWYTKIVENFPAVGACQESRRRPHAAGIGRQVDSAPRQGRDRRIGGPGQAARQGGPGSLLGDNVASPARSSSRSSRSCRPSTARTAWLSIGVSLDSNGQDLVDYLKRNRLPWPQLFEPGGLDSRYATEMGIILLPTMILIDDKGKVVNRGIHITEVDNELKKLLDEK